MAWRHFLTAFYPAGHPYAHPMIGSTEDIEGATLDDVKHWFQGHYGAGNAVLVLSGDIDAATAREKITRYFGAIRPGTPISRPLQWTPSLTETRRDRLYGDFAQTSISRSWPIPNTSPRDTTLLLLAARAMAGPKDAPLVRALVTDAKVATGVTATVNESALGSVLNLSIGVRPGVSPEVASRALDAALADYATKGPPPSRLQSIIAATDASLLRSLDDNAAVGNRLGEGEVAHGDPAYFLKQRAWINDARPDEVRAVAAKWLTRPYYEMITMPVPDRQAGSADVDRSHMPAPGPFKSEIAFPRHHHDAGQWPKAGRRQAARNRDGRPRPAIRHGHAKRSGHRGGCRHQCLSPAGRRRQDAGGRARRTASVATRHSTGGPGRPVEQRGSLERREQPAGRLLRARRRSGPASGLSRDRRRGGASHDAERTGCGGPQSVRVRDAAAQPGDLGRS
ncbi:insulinase family protein [Sphingomonas sp. I4]